MSQEAQLNISVSLTSAQIQKQGFQTLIMTDPDKAKEVYLLMGHTEDAADALIKETLDAVKEAEVKAGLKDTADLITAALKDALSTMVMPDEVGKLTCSVKYDAAEHPETGEVIGFIVTNPSITPTGSDKAINYSTGTPRKSSGGGDGTKRPRVKVPDDLGYSSWTAYGQATYPEHNFAGKSAPRELASLKDATFLAAAAADGVSYADDAQGHVI